MDSWERIKQCLAQKTSDTNYKNWVARTVLRSVDGGRIRVLVPDETTRDWIQEELGDAVNAAIRELKLPFREVAYEVRQAPTAASGGAVGAVPAFEEAAEIQFATPASQLNPKFTFDSFVVGSCNQFAHAAAKAVATNPARRYNPLFIYGGVGMGKTHLMHAIGRQLLEAYTTMRIVYTSSERFMNELITCIRLQRMPQFHRHYRSADVLLVDDIQVLANKERTQEEFFHTFNELYDHQKQIVISSDSPPKNTPGLVERLRSRFEWGLMVDVQPPDLETKMAILDKKAETLGLKLPEEVRIFVATKTKSNVRELEGALTKMVAYSSVTGSAITLAMAQQVLKHLTGVNDRRVSIDSIIRAVAEHFNLPPGHIKQKTNARQIAYPRQVAMYLAKELTSASLPEIGRAFGGKHHTTVLHSIHKIEQERLRNPDLNRTIHSLIDSLN
jgi:chromosomal replication initiator protein